MSKINPTTMHELGEKLMDYLSREGHDDFVLFLNDQMWAPQNSSRATHTTSAGTPYRATDDIEVEMFIRGSNCETISITYDGSLYDAINGESDPTLETLQSFLAPYALHFEMIDPFTLVAHEI